MEMIVIIEFTFGTHRKMRLLRTDFEFVSHLQFISFTIFLSRRCIIFIKLITFSVLLCEKITMETVFFNKF